MTIIETAPFAAAGGRIRRLRQEKGLSRSELARKLRVDVSSIAGWETGKRLPRDTHRSKLARALDCELPVLLSPVDDTPAPLKGSLVDTTDELPAALAECARNAKHWLRALRLAAPYPTPAYVQTEWRSVIGDRLMAGTIEVRRIEIFYDLKRLQETLWNILRYDGKAYHIKAHCVGLKDVAPLMSAYCFDGVDYFFGAYWAGVPPQKQNPGLRLSGPIITEFFSHYWTEIWGRGVLLNLRGGHDLSAVQDVAVKLGLHPRNWKKFVEEARELKIGDGAPPLI
jgi:transcriptional regulator with XRE-family HTH domain